MIQNNTTLKRNTAHKTTDTIKDTLHRVDTNNHNYNYINALIVNLSVMYE
jgi:hypothetical protein